MDFQPAPRRKKGSKKYVVVEKLVEDYVEEVARCTKELESSRFWKELSDQLRKASRPINSCNTIICLALGSPTDSSIALYQLALLQLLRGALLQPNRTAPDVKAYDPVFSDKDKQLLKKLDIQLHSDDSIMNEIDGFIYMPHAPASLTNRVLVHRPCVLLGNLLSDYDTKLVGHGGEKLSQLDELAQAVEQLKLRSNDEESGWIALPVANHLSSGTAWFSAVNDMALHFRKPSNHDNECLAGNQSSSKEPSISGS